MKILCINNQGAEQYLALNNWYEILGSDDEDQYPIIINEEELYFNVGRFIEKPPTEMPETEKQWWIDNDINPLRCTCLWCDWQTNKCEFKFDPYNTDGDCLIEK